MILVIGEIAEEYRKADDGTYRRLFSGTGLEWAERLPGSYLLTVLASDNAAHDMSSYLSEKGIRHSSDFVSSLPSAVIADQDRHYMGTAPVSLQSEDIMERISSLSVDAVVVSSVLLSYNPSSSAIIDTLSFLVPQPKLAIDTSIVVEEGKNIFSKTEVGSRIDLLNLLQEASW